MSKILIIGSGAWGGALGNNLIINKHDVYYYCINPAEKKDLLKGKNTKFFGSAKFDGIPKIISDDLKMLLEQKPDAILLAIPSVFLLDTINKMTPLLKNKPVFINAVKGINIKTGNPWSIDIKKILGSKCAGLSTLIGPSFAIDVFNKNRTIINNVSSDKKTANKVAKLFETNFFKCVSYNDEIGAELCAALKNVLALACGIVFQLHISINTRSIIFTQGIKEISLIIRAKKGDIDSILNFCGVGDIYLTCNSDLSRNFTFGKLIAKKGVKQAIKLNQKTVEGYYALKAAKKLVDYYKIKAPMIESLYDVIYNNADPKKLIDNVFNKII